MNQNSNKRSVKEATGASRDHGTKLPRASAGPLLQDNVRSLSGVRPREKESTIGTQCGSNFVSYDVARRGTNIVARRLDTRKVSEVFQEHFLCPGHNISVRHKCCAGGKTSQHLGNSNVAATFVLVWPPLSPSALQAPSGIIYLLHRTRGFPNSLNKKNYWTRSNHVLFGL